MKRLLRPELERELRRVLGRWRWQRFWRDASLLAFTLAALFAALALFIHRGHLKSPPAAILIVLGLLGAGGLAFLIVTAFAFASRRPRAWLASSLETVYEPMLDRLNTLVHLEPARHQADVSPYFRRIEGQAVDAVPIGGLPLPFRWRTTLLMALGALIALAGTFELYRRLEPWERLSWNEEHASSTELPDPEGPPLAPPEEGAAEVKAAWGEVRITEPGRDLKVTKVDVVPLQVEAASDQPLKAASWSTATNGAAPRAHALPAPPEPNYAVYRPMLYVDELRLQDWDVVSYFASANTTKGASYASEIYFLEVRPFREDIAKMPGGEGGAAYQGLNELTGLIDRQRHILRETHRYQQAGAGQRAEQRRQDRAKLADAEADLGQAVRHLYAKLAAEMENQPIGDVLTHLAAAEGWIDEAHAALRADAPTAMAKEQGALTELVATRKSFQKFISENPDAFQDGQGESGEDTPTAKLPEELKQILELRDQEKAAQELVKKTIDAQRKLAEKTAAEEGERGALAEEQMKLAGPLRDLKASQPKAFKGAEKEADAAVSALENAAKAMEQPAASEGGAEAAQRDAVSALEKLDGALGRKRLAKELGHAYKLKEALDREAEELGRMQAQPGQSSAEQAARAARDAKQAARGLKKIVEEKPGQDAFGPELRQALSEKPLRDLESRLDALEKAQGEGERGTAAGEAKGALERVSQAFEQSQPPVMKELKADRLKGGAEEALETALAQLDGLTAREKAPARRRTRPSGGARSCSTCGAGWKARATRR